MGILDQEALTRNGASPAGGITWDLSAESWSSSGPGTMVVSKDSKAEQRGLPSWRGFSSGWGREQGSRGSGGCGGKVGAGARPDLLCERLEGGAVPLSHLPSAGWHVAESGKSKDHVIAYPSTHISACSICYCLWQCHSSTDRPWVLFLLGPCTCCSLCLKHCSIPILWLTPSHAHSCLNFPWEDFPAVKRVPRSTPSPLLCPSHVFLAARLLDCVSCTLRAGHSAPCSRDLIPQ